MIAVPAFSIRLTHAPLIVLVLVAALYAPARDLVAFFHEHFADAYIEIKTVSFGEQQPWQTTNQGPYVKAAQSLTQPQKIYARLKLANPSSETQTYRKLWLYFEHENGNREYTTDYVLYDPTTRKQLIGGSIDVGPHSHLEVLAAYRYIPSFQNEEPSTMSVSWENSSVVRQSSCAYQLSTSSMTQVGSVCE